MKFLGVVGVFRARLCLTVLTVVADNICWLC